MQEIFRFTNISTTPWVKHAISTRAHGNLKENRESFFNALGVREEDVVGMNQVHGNHVAVVGKPERGHTILETDAMITATPKVPLFIKVADCVPILLVDPVKRVIGVIHAGWRGTALEIARLTVDHMEDHFGVRPQDLVAGIGPSIGPCCYEVDTPVIEVFNKFPYKDKLFSKKHGVAANLDLWSANKFQLIARGVPGKNIEVAEICTYDNSNLFFSDRKLGKLGERFGGIIAIQN